MENNGQDLGRLGAPLPSSFGSGLWPSFGLILVIVLGRRKRRGRIGEEDQGASVARDIEEIRLKG
jgi:hypothetical protein